MTTAASIPRLVHLDLKGAPPKISYVTELLPYLKQCGIAGLLVEYEDTFPYVDRLSPLADEHAYKLDEIQDLLSHCDRLGLNVIPLVQTFGHAEFILRHEAFQHLREVDSYANCFCPSNDDSLTVITMMLEQLLAVHQNTAYLHIGCDEVYHIGHCKACVERMELELWTTEHLFASHVARIATFVKERHPSVRVIIWDDMIRKTPLHVLQRFGLAELVEPMVWHYGSDQIPNVFEVYAPIFPRIWCASAFKGASGPCETIPDIALHVNNHKLWVAVINDQLGKNVHIAGIVVTGWSRYDHFGVLCELLPVGIPSLVVCLQILSSACFTPDVHLNSSRLLGAEQYMPLQWKPRPMMLITDLRFPGVTIFIGSQIQANLRHRFLEIVNSNVYCGWAHNFNLKRGRISVAVLNSITEEAQKLLVDFDELKENVRPAMLAIYPERVMEEWFGEHVDPYANKIRKIIANIEKVTGSSNKV